MRATVQRRPSFSPRRIWRGIQEIIDEEMEEDVIVKAVDCSNQSEIWSLDSPEPEYHLPETDFKGIMFLEFFTRYGWQYLIIADEDHKAHFKLCKVRSIQFGQKGIPYLNTYDGRTIRYPDPLIKANDTIKIDLETNKIMDFIKFDVGNVVMVTGGRNTGRVGVIKNREKHKGSFETIMYFSLDLEYTYVCVV
ncbi:Putative ribosomal protein S4 (RPS4A) family protein [Zea mays]|uniref:Putative ribosomal protein S4 (RPS4A) family protein n=1 Tax=Zea mays TaxID=4577 RepID=A0A1D6FIZ7_MAIZE|nr:Putative ribosomal protein S4 (RPS4A) family protein [Zea mays]